MSEAEGEGEGKAQQEDWGTRGADIAAEEVDDESENLKGLKSLGRKQKNTGARGEESKKLSEKTQHALHFSTLNSDASGALLFVLCSTDRWSTLECKGQSDGSYCEGCDEQHGRSTLYNTAILKQLYCFLMNELKKKCKLFSFIQFIMHTNSKYTQNKDGA